MCDQQHSSQRRGQRSKCGLSLELVQARTELAVSLCRLKSMPVEARLESVRRKRQAQLERLLLPDAPPRKKPARSPSPERDLCHLLSSEMSQPAESEPVIQIKEEEPVIQVKEETEDPLAEAEAGPYMDISKLDFIVLGQPVEVQQTQASLNVTGNSDTILINTQLSDDSDTDVDDDAFSLSAMRNAATEPACQTDMTEIETRVLLTEDDFNDRALRDVVTSDDYYHFDWKEDGTTFTGKRESFTEKSGPTFDVTDMTPADIFRTMFDRKFIDRLCTETNRYADQKIASLEAEGKLAPNSRVRRWTPTDRDEMITFLAVLILEGLYPLPEEEKYFSFNGYGTMPYFARIMSYNRFFLLKMFYHFVDNTTTDRTKLCKIQPVIDHLNDKFSTLYMPSQEVAIDESLLRCHGRLSFSQKIATKAAPVGIKMYELCESRSGYLWRFFVHTGKNTGTGSTDELPTDDTTDRPDDHMTDRPDDHTTDRPEVARPTNATAKIVLDLIEPLLHRGHTLIMDSFYNSPLLLRYLKRRKTDCYGTLRLNREFVPDSVKTVTKTDLRQGEVVVTYTSDLSVMVWRDANLVSMISTYHHLEVGTQNKYNKVTYKPKIVLDYNKSTGGVDRKDQSLSAHPVERLKNKVWYKKVFCRLFSAAIYNAFVIFGSKHPKISHRQFRTALAEELLLTHRHIDLKTEHRLFTNRTDQIPYGNGNNQQTTTVFNHFPVRTPGKSPRCKFCSQRKIVSRTRFKCIQCNISLCIDNCFQDYHIAKANRT